MSAICGFWLRDGRPASKEGLSPMMQALAHRGRDGCGAWREGSVALGHQMTHITPESLTETLPLHHPLAGVAITADARIDNRDDLALALGMSRGEAVGMPDSLLVLQAYEKWGHRCAERLEGAYAFAIWDAVRGKLTCVTDPMGARSIYYFCDDRKFVFASEIKGVIRGPGAPCALNEDLLLGIALPWLYREDLGRTHYIGIRRVPPATILTVSYDSVREEEYWRPDVGRRLPYKSEEETLEALRELLFRTMKAYTRSAFPVAATLSGGLDSSAVTSVASAILGAAGRRLTVFSAVLSDNGPPGYQDEREYIEAFNGWPNTDIVYDAAPGRGPFDDVARTVWSADTPAISPHHYQIASFAELARARGARVILHGLGGELGLTSKATGYLAELLVCGKWLALWREARAQADRYGGSLWRLLGVGAVKPLIPDSLARWLKSRIDLAKLPGVEFCPLAGPLMRRQWQSHSSAIDKLKRERSQPSPDHRVNQLKAILFARYCNEVISAHAGYEHVRHLSPWTDRRVVEFCLAAPGSLKMKNGFTRYLARGALANDLPPVLRERITKGSAVMDIFDRYNRQLPAVREELAAISPKDPVRSVVDVEKLKQMASAELPTTDMAWMEPKKLANLGLVPSGVYLVQFVRQFADFR